MASRFTKLVLGLFLTLGLLSTPGAALANNPAATAAGLAIDAVIVGLQAAIAADSAVSGGNAGTAAARTAEETGDKVIDPVFATVIREVGLNLLNFVVNRLAYDAAVALSSGGKAQTALVEFQSPEAYFKDLGLDLVGETIESLDDALSKALDQEFNICAPKDPVVKLSLQIGLKQAYTRNAPRCEFQNFLDNVSAIGARYTGEEGGNQNILRQFAKAYQPGQSELSASIDLTLGVHQQVNLLKELGTAETLENKGFKNVVDAVTGQVKTPALLIAEQTKLALVLAKNPNTSDLTSLFWEDAEVLKQIGLSGLSVFANTLLSSLANNIFSGIFVPPDLGFDPFNPNSVVQGGRERAQETYRSILAAPILSFDDYNVMNEFVICPGDDLRGLNNCVMDSAFASAVSRAQSGVPLTVQEAIDEGFLHGDWPLIPSSDEGRNQDLLCQTYGYCYSNLVKMRKARLIPIGWELAADSPFNEESSPVTLQQAIDGFFACDDQGQANSTYKWCHLIDPNWVLKIPPAQCRAFVPSELPISGLVNARQSVCVDSPTCIAQDDSGACIGGYGYCTEETNTWQFRGDACPAEYAGCLTFNNVRTGSAGNYLLNTVNTEGCSSDNPGCRWYRSQKYEDDKGTSDTTDDTFEFLPTGETYTLALHDLAVGLTNLATPATFGYDTDADGTNDFTYSNYAFEDRLYVNQNVGTCSEESAGCTELISASSANLNLLRNPSFEDDVDEDDIPDGWTEISSSTFPGGYDVISGAGFNGSDALTNASGAISVQQTGIALSPNRFYTLSLYVNTVTSATPGRTVAIELIPQTGSSAINLTGTTVLGDCSVSSANTNTVTFPLLTTAGDGYVRKTCTFTTPSVATFADVTLVDTSGSTDETYYDAFQLELGSVASSFQIGYGTGSVTREYLTVPPTWLGCTGAASDPAECASYTRVCTAQDVGCDLYTPTLGGFGVPAVTSAADTCPQECVGYETYKQEATPYEAENFPLYFIASSARTCSQADVGCDAYTNVDQVALGGEGIEYYSGLRFCSAPATPSSPSSLNEATYYTWEGTESEGFQLRSWSLLESDLADTQTTAYVEGSAPATTVFSEINVGKAPCTNARVASENSVTCDDGVQEPRALTETNTFTTCNQHTDIFDNPDCREFYDTSGNIHYRLLSQTVVISESCAPYRKDNGLQTDCEASGGFWTAGGSCRYFVLAGESASCSAEAAGCRAYTGASGRNASTIFTDTFEGGNLNAYPSAFPAVLSNESVSAGGNSLAVTGGTLNTLSLVEGTADITAGDTNTNSKCDASETCTLEEAGVGTSTCQVTGTDVDNVDDCGPMVGQLAQGKTYILEFWAKGNGPVQTFGALQGTAQLRPRLVDARGVGSAHTFSTLGNGLITITPSWQSYTIGPLDTSDATLFANFDDTAILQFLVSSGTADYYIDNINLRETEENLALIKNSWVTPSTCDLSPTGTPSPQHYLGCQEYQDGAGTRQNLHQFTRLCSEEVIGCSAYFDTQNSEKTFAQTFNATCSQPTPVSVATACTMDGETVCTIVSGRSDCHFDVEGSLPNPLPSSPFSISLGPEARVVSNDTDLFLVNTGSTSCGAAVAGCTEVGLPTFSQDKATVTSFETMYVIDDPDQYTTTLCDTEGLFCEAWNTTADGTFYFKDPSNQTCDYRASVTINNQQYSGWFRTGSTPTAPCYYDDTTPANGQFDVAELSTAYLISGIEFGIWRNGDETNYDGWLATCSERYNRCTDFIDPVDTSNGLYPNGTPYVYIKNEKIDESRRSASERCNGQVNLNEGCALFFDAVHPELPWNASASYLVSEHADVFFGGAQQSSQSPVSCEGSAVGNDVGRILTSSGVEFNVCQSRCVYNPPTVGNPPSVGVISHPYAELNNGKYYTTSCLQNSDCATVKDSNNQTVIGSCVQGYTTTPVGSQPTYDADLIPITSNDVNDVRRVVRDRECSEWLTCKSTIQVWDERTGRFREICDQIGACTQYSKVGDVNICTGFATETAQPLSMSRYIDRDISWWGQDFSGYAIPDNIPAQLLDQVNINPAYWCSDDYTTSCTTATVATDCGTGATCEPADEDIRLAYNAGTCESVIGEEQGGSCYVGTCQNSGFACSNDNECDTNTNELCVVGFCEQTLVGVACSVTADCTGGTGFSCQSGLCKKQTEATCSPNATIGCGIVGPTISSQCILQDNAFEGGCFGNRCLLASDGAPFAPTFTNAMECKAYPEQNSPYPHQVLGGGTPGQLTSTGIVTQWIDPASGSSQQPQSTLMNILDGLDTITPEEAQDWINYTKRPGYQGIQTCAPDGGDCSCTYQKVTYGNSIKTKYYSRDATDFLTGVCLGGNDEGMECTTDENCNLVGMVNTGRCVKPTSVETLLGVDGYCLERDTAINKWKDPNQTFGGECLTWLPVDQLAGSNDIYNAYTEAGFPLEDRFYCTDTSLYVDLYVTGATDPSDPASNTIFPGCAESKRGSSNNTGFGADGSCNVDEYDGCQANAHCPLGYFAILGTCDDGTLGQPDNCQTGSRATSGSDDDCPYFCVPSESRNGVTGQICETPSVSNSNSTSSPGWVTDVYRVGQLSDTNAPGGLDWIEYYKNCTLRGVPYDYPSVANPAYQRLDPEYLASSGNGYLQGNNDRYYLGCREVALIGSVDDGNKAWTNRLWEGNPGFTNSTAPSPWALIDTSLDSLNYTAQTSFFAPAGGVYPGALSFSSSSNDLQNILGLNDQYPVPVAACQVGSNLVVARSVDEYLCTAYPDLPEEDILGRSYEYASAVAPSLNTGTTCIPGDDSTCNAAASCSGNVGCFVSCDLQNIGCEFDTDGDGSIDVDYGDCLAEDLTTPVALEYFCSVPVVNGNTCASAGYASYSPPSPTPTDFFGPGSQVYGLYEYNTCSIGSGPVAGLPCLGDGMCYGTATCAARPGGGGRCTDATITSITPTLSVGGTSGSTASFTSHLSQFFTKVFSFWMFEHEVNPTLDQTGSYIVSTTSTSPLDVSSDPNNYSVFQSDPNFGGTAPVVRGLGDCFSAGCREAADDTITVNGVTSGTILGDFGAAHVSVQFFAQANANQLPIRNVVVNFGDGFQSGSTGNANYYKNRRGLDEDDNDSLFCGQGDQWGETSASCDPNYFTFTHDYICSTQLVSEAGLPECGDANADLSDGCRTTDNKCQYTPRVYVKDNWGYCAGECGTLNGSPAGTACYDSTGIQPLPYNECNPECDAKLGSCLASTLLNQVINPWIEFDGVVRVEP